MAEIIQQAKDIQMISISDIKPNPKNMNVHTKSQIERLCRIIEYQGFRSPLVVSSRTGLLVSGHGRLEAAKKLGMGAVPVIIQDFADDDQEYAAMVSENSIASWSELDFSAINSELQNFNPDFDIDLLGIKNFKIDVAEKGLTDPDAVPDNVETRVKPGDIWVLGNHRLKCGDSTNVQHVDELMAGELADIVFTDPPYGVNYDGGHAEPGIRREKLAGDHSTDIYKDSIPNMFHLSKPKAALYIWFAATNCLQVLQVLQDNDYEVRSWLIWNKNMAQFGAIGAQYKQKHEPCIYAFKKGNSPFWDGPNNEVSVWDVARASKNEFHPTQKPTELSERAITNSCPKDGIVLDLFGGSGSTLIGAENTGRGSRIMELSPAYCSTILKRWEQYTGRQAELAQEST